MTEERAHIYPDWDNLPIKYLILSCQDFIVFIDSENDLDWKTTDQFDKREICPEKLVELNSILNSTARVESIPTDKLQEKVVVNFKRQVGEALVRAFEDDFDNATQMIEAAEEFVTNRNIEQSRYIYLTGSAIAVTGLSLVGVILWLLRDWVTNLLGTTGFYLGLSMICGALGAFLSIILRMGKEKLDFHASKELHYLESLSRLSAGMISAFLIALTIKAGILLPVINKIDSMHTAMLLGGLVAGSSERLAPSIIKKIDGSKPSK